LITAFNSCNVTLYAPYRALNVAFRGDLCRSTLRLLPQHLQWQTIPHFPLQRPGCVLPGPQCHPAPEGAVLGVRPLRDVVARMSVILISVRTVYSSKVLVSLHRDVRHLRYDIHFSLPSLEF
jgi:hypothetical protein